MTKTGIRTIEDDMEETAPVSVRVWTTWAEKAVAWGKIAGAVLTFVAAFYAAFKPTDERKTKAVYDTVKPVIEGLERQNRLLEDRVAVLEYRLEHTLPPLLAPRASAVPASASPVAAPPTFTKEHPLPPHVPTFLPPHSNAMPAKPSMPAFDHLNP